MRYRAVERFGDLHGGRSSRDAGRRAGGRRGSVVSRPVAVCGRAGCVQGHARRLDIRPLHAGADPNLAFALHAADEWSDDIQRSADLSDNLAEATTNFETSAATMYAREIGDIYEGLAFDARQCDGPLASNSAETMEQCADAYFATAVAIDDLDVARMENAAADLRRCATNTARLTDQITGM